MTKTQANTLRIQMHSALDQAFESTTLAAARCCLETALSSAKLLADGGMLTEHDRSATAETFAALAPRGWVN